MISLTDRLAVERTELANERTFLAYVRTGLALMGGGVALAQLFDDPVVTTIGLGFTFAGLAALGIGWIRYRTVKRRLDQMVEERARVGPPPP